MIFIFNPYLKAGGGMRIQTAFFEVLRTATDKQIVAFTQLRQFIRLFLLSPSDSVIVIQSIYAWRSIVVLLVFQLVRLTGITSKCVIIPRGDRLPIQLLDPIIKSSIKKFIYSRIFLLISKNVFFIYGSDAEANHYLNIGFSSRWRTISDPNFYTHDFIHEPSQINVQYFTFFGRLSFEKNINFLIDVFRQNTLKQLGINLRLYVIGDVKVVNRLRDLVHSDHNIHVFQQLQTTEEVFGAMKSSVVLNPSLYESFGLVPLEAICAGAGFISAPVGEWQKENSVGLVLELSKEAWTKAVMDFHEKGIQNNKFERSHILKKFDILEIKRKWKEVLENE